MFFLNTSINQRYTPLVTLLVWLNIEIEMFIGESREIILL